MLPTQNGEIWRFLCHEILREITFGNFWVAKTAILTFFATQNFEILGIFNIYISGIFSEIKIQGLQNGQICSY